MRGRVAAALLLALPALAPPGAAGQWTALNVPQRSDADSSFVEAGRAVYETHCWYCHGEEGDGSGPVAEYLWPRPRDFQIASFKFRTTPSGELPTDEDLFRTITLGAPGTAMPAWGDVLTERERWQVVAYLKSFGAGIFEDEAFDPYDVAVEVDGPPSGPAEALVEAGREVYRSSDCWECHGPAGRGDGQRAEQLTDDRGLPIPATDLELAWKFRGGSAPRDIYLRLTTGLDRTPMPSYAQTLTDEERWQVAYYVSSLAVDATRSGSGPVVIPATRPSGPLPERPDDDAWDEATPVRIPLTGQATYAPRWQIPAVTDLVVEALHDGGAVALRVSWNDPYADSLAQPPDDAAAEGWSGDDSYPVVYPGGQRVRGRYRDQLELLYPSAESGPGLPHFVYGDAGRTVDLWRWTAAGSESAGPLEELRAAGVEQRPRPLPDGRQRAVGAAAWVEGRWRVVLRRPVTDDAPFRPGALVPVAFHLREGSHGETGLRMALSSWYYLHLREPLGAPRFLLVIVAVVAAAAVEYGAVRAARGMAADGRLEGYGAGR